MLSVFVISDIAATHQTHTQGLDIDIGYRIEANLFVFLYFCIMKHYEDCGQTVVSERDLSVFTSTNQLVCERIIGPRQRTTKQSEEMTGSDLPFFVCRAIELFPVCPELAKLYTKLPLKLKERQGLMIFC